ncbi:MAG TPA: DinB family protein [Chloroflexia bacterium]|nr:DinB family protein [Chloroflexia bacterium]
MSQPVEEPALVELFRFNTWATLKLLDGCSGLHDAQLDWTAPGTFGSIRDTLTHLSGSEGGYVYQLTGQRPPIPMQEDAFLGIPALRERTCWFGEQLAHKAATVRRDDTFQSEWQGEIETVNCLTVLTQALVHGVDHRSQIATILSQHGVEPPDIDSWAYAEEMKQAERQPA